MGIASRVNPTTQLASAPARVRDAVGRVLEIGDEVVMVVPKVILRIAEIKPLLDPGAPAGVMVVTMVTRVQMAIGRDGAIEDLYRLRHQAEIGDGAIPSADPREGLEGRDEAQG